MGAPLGINKETGYLESQPNVLVPSLNYNPLTAEKKQLFLRAALQCIENKKFPALHTICESLEINMRTLQVHLQKDELFRQHWDEVKERLKSLYTDKLADKAEGKQGTLANLAMLRYLETGTWVMNGQPVTNNASINNGQSQINGYIDAELVDNPPKIGDNGTNQAINPAEQGNNTVDDVATGINKP